MDKWRVEGRWSQAGDPYYVVCRGWGKDIEFYTGSFGYMTDANKVADKLNEKEGEAKILALKPCPFCGGEAELADAFMEGNESKRYYSIVCPNCHIGIFPVKLDEWDAYDTPEIAVEAWNMRT